MASIDRIAYPRFKRVVSARELSEAFTPTTDEVEWARTKTTTEQHFLALVVLLKCYVAAAAQQPDRLQRHQAVTAPAVGDDLGAFGEFGQAVREVVDGMRLLSFSNGERVEVTRLPGSRFSATS